MVTSQNTVIRGTPTDPVVNNNININKISINNFYNRQDPSQELYSMRSRRASGLTSDRPNDQRAKTDPSASANQHKKNFSLNEQNLKGDQFDNFKK